MIPQHNYGKVIVTITERNLSPHSAASTTLWSAPQQQQQLLILNFNF